MSAINLSVQGGGSLRATLRPPGDKSISHRAIIFGSLALGQTKVSGFLRAEDAMATLQAFRAMGVQIETGTGGELLIEGVGKHGLTAPSDDLYLGNSGTAMRLLTGLLAGQKFNSVLTGDKSLTTRPMRRITEPLAAMGATISTNDGCAPLAIVGNPKLCGIDYTMPMASAQVKSCLLLAGMFATGHTTVREPAPTRDHSEKMLAGFGYPVHSDNGTVTIDASGQLRKCTIDIPADISSAAFFLVGATIAPNSNLTLQHVGINPTRTGVITILQLMGAAITINNERLVGGEAVADLQVQSSQLHGIDIPPELVPLAIDEFPALFVAAACAKGRTTLQGAHELQVKECDRLTVMAQGLQHLGVRAKTTDGGIVIDGNNLQPFSGGTVQTHGDHRIAMAFAMAALRASATITIEDCANINTSFPEFRQMAIDAGLRLL